MSSTIWPPVVQPRYLIGRVTSSTAAESIPAVARAVMLHQLASIMKLERVRGTTLLPSMRVLEQPDPTRPGSTWFIQQYVRDWLLEGNACSLITVRDRDDQAMAHRWAPAWRWNILADPFGGGDRYYLDGVEVDPEDVIHVRRNVDQMNLSRGVGIVEQHLRTLNVATLQIDAESQALSEGGVPSVAVIAPQSDVSPDDAKDAGAAWAEMFAGPGRVPGIFPKGTEIKPLSWSPTDAQMIEARKMNAIDVANLTGIDPYWFGASAGSHQYKSPGPMWLTLLRTPLEEMLQLMEDAFSDKLTPRGQRVRFRRRDLTRDDLASTITAMKEAKASGLFSHEEAREQLDMDPAGGRPDLGLGDQQRGLREQLDELGVGNRAGTDPNVVADLVGLPQLKGKFIGYPASVLPYDRNPVKDPTSEPPVPDDTDPTDDPTSDPTEA